MSEALELLVKQKGHPDRRVVLRPGVLVLGRADDADLCLPDIGVSRRHARIVVDSHGVTYEDLGSGNGSWFMGKRVGTQTVVSGDTLTIEPFVLHFVDSPSAKRAKAAALEPVLGTDPGLIQAELVALNGTTPAPGSRIPIPATGLRIGRSEREDLTLSDASASRHHADIQFMGSELVLRDPGAANGLYVNAQRVSEHRLQHGDVVRIGDTELRFERVGAPQLHQGPPDRTEAFDKDLIAKLLAEEDAEAERDMAARDKAARDKAARDQAARDKAARDQAARDKAAREQAARDKAARDKAARERAAAAPPPPVQAPAGPPPVPGLGAPGLGSPGLGAPAGGFGAPAAGAFGAPPPAGDQPAFGGAAPKGLSPKGTPAADKRGFFSKPINLISVGLLGLSLLGVVVKAAMDSAGDSPGPAQISTTALSSSGIDLSANDVALVDELMQEGMERFRAQDYSGASGKFLRVLQLDPGHPDAERMGYVACEFIAIQHLQGGLQLRISSDAERSQAKSDALALAESVRGGRGSLSQATKAVRAALVLNPKDEELTRAQAQLRRQAGAATQAASVKQQEAFTKDLSGLFDKAQAALDAGRYSEATKGFRSVLREDPEGRSPYASRAQAGLSQSQARQRELADGPYLKGIQASKAGDLQGARRYLQEALRYDPAHAGASSTLSEINATLRKQAMDKFHEGKTYEKANQTDKALSAYAECQRLLGDRSSDLHRSAQVRIDALIQ